MKKLFVLLFLPIGILAQTTELNNTVEKSKDSTEKPQEVKDAKSDAVEAKLLSTVCSSGDCLDGVGTMNDKSGTYIGHWKEGLRHGEGKYVWNNGDMYNGNWDLDKRHGQGIYVWHDGSKYIGNYSCGVRSGYGLYYYTNGTIYEGTWQNNLKHGIANFYYKESVNLGGKYFNNEYVGGTGVTQGTYKYKPE